MSENGRARIVVVDDEPANVLLLERLLELWGYDDVVTTTRSAEVPELCLAAAPDLLLLDLHMPRPDGFEVLERLRELGAGAGGMPVIVLTADITVGARRRALELGARDFLTKPFDQDEVRLRVGNHLEMRRLQRALERQNEELEERVRARTAQLRRTRRETLERLALAAEYRDDDTKEHADRVGRTAAMLAELLGLPEAEVETIRDAAPLHDIGKIAISDMVLLKPGPLTPDEFELMKTHAPIGEAILGGTSSQTLQVSAELAASHHERWDGGGYPHGLAGDAIPIVGRITAVADVFDALTHDRPYKRAWPPDQAAAEIVRGSGTHFDPQVVEAFAHLDPARLLAPLAAGQRSGGTGS